jgi:integrase
MIVSKRYTDIYNNDEIFKLFYGKFYYYLILINISKENLNGLLSYFYIFYNSCANDIKNNSIDRTYLINYLQRLENNCDSLFITKNKTINKNSLKPKTRRYIGMINKIIQSKIFPKLNNDHIIKEFEISPLEKQVEYIERDYFTQDELDKISQQYKNEKEKLVITLLLTTGIRCGGLQNLEVQGVFDENLNVLNDGWTVEKKLNKKRIFPIYPHLKQALEEYKNSKYGNVLSKPEFKLIPRKIVKDNKLIGNVDEVGRNTIRGIITNLCDRAGIKGTHLHPHAFRKTLVIKLMEQGNSIDHVSKFIGHSNSSVTMQHYWVPTTQDLINSMNMEWLLGENNLKHNNNDNSSTTNTLNKEQINKILETLLEGFKAQEQLKHSKELLNSEELITLEQKWTQESTDKVRDQALQTLKQIISMATNISSDNSSI